MTHAEISSPSVRVPPTASPGRRVRSVDLSPEPHGTQVFNRDDTSAGRRRKPESVSVSTATVVTEDIECRVPRPVGSRRRVVTTPQVKPHSPSAGYRRIASRPKVSPFVKSRLIPVGGISALVLASVAAFVDVSAVNNTVQYKDVITAAAVSASIDSTSRSVERDPLVDSASANAGVEGKRYIKSTIPVKADALSSSATLAELERGDTVQVTGVTDGDWVQIVHNDLPRWVEKGALSTEVVFSDEELRTRWVLPVDRYRLTAHFGDRSGLWSSGHHTGLDFAAPTGTPIYAIASGTVVSSGYTGRTGLQTVIELEDGTQISYAHQSWSNVHAGQEVLAGHHIGNVGSTGNSTGPHVHVEIMTNGETLIDPYTELVNHGLRP